MTDAFPTGTTPSEHSHAVRTFSRAERDRLTDELLREAQKTVDEGRRSVLLDRVILLNRAVAEAVANSCEGQGVPVEALYPAAFEGLVRAVETFDPAVDPDLATHAIATIEDEVRRWLREQSWLVRPRPPGAEP